jgi:hypothetical protein
VFGGALVHDLLWLPVVALAGVVVSRVAKRRPPRVLLWALATSAVLAVVAWPFVRGYGRRPGDPSLLPRNYAAGLATYLAVIWTVALTVAGVGVAVRALRRSRSGAPPPSEELNG